MQNYLRDATYISVEKRYFAKNHMIKKLLLSKDEKKTWALCLCLFFPLYHYYYTTHCTSMMSSINIWSVFWFCYKVNAKLWILSRLDSSESWSFLDILNFWKWLYEMSRLRIHLITLIYTKLQNSKKANKKRRINYHDMQVTLGCYCTSIFFS